MKEDDFWALWQARVDAKVADNAAAIRIVRCEWEETLIFSKTYRNRFRARANVL